MSSSGRRIVRQLLVCGALLSAAIAIGAASLPDVIGRPRSVLLLLNATFWLSWTALAPIVMWLAERVPILPGRRLRAVAVHVLASAVFAGLHVVLISMAALLVDDWLLGRSLSEAWPLIRFPTRMHVELELTMYWALVALAHAVSFRMESQARALQAAQLETQLTQAQLTALQRQLQPHFLFNTLHTISALVYKNAEEADRMIERLGYLLRLTLTGGEAVVVSLERELHHLRYYLDIEQANLGERLKVRIDVAPDTLHAAVPALLLQPLVENAVRHGLAPRASGGSVCVVARAEGARLLLQIIDDGLGLNAAARSSGTGIGVQNTRNRLQQFYGDSHRLEIVSPEGGGVQVTIDVPLRDVPLPASTQELAWTC